MRQIWMAGLLVMGGVTVADAQCISRGVYSKQTYCFGSGNTSVRTYIDRGPSQWDVFQGLLRSADRYLDVGNLSSAIDDMQAALRLFPTDPTALALKRRVDAERAEEERRLDARHRESQLRYWRESAQRLIATGQWRQASEELARRVLELRGQNRWEASVEFAELLRQVNERIEAELDEADAARNQAQQRAVDAEIAQGTQAARESLDSLERSLQGPVWNEALIALQMGNNARGSLEADTAAWRARVPFDDVRGAQMARTPQAPTAVRGVPRPLPPAALGRALLREMETIEQYEGSLAQQMQAARDDAQRARLQRDRDMLRGMRAIAEVKLITISVRPPEGAR